MELSDDISVERFLEFTQDQKNELCATLVELSAAVSEIPRKSLRKTLDITLAALKYKFDEIRVAVTAQDGQNERVLKENAKLKLMLENLEDVNATYKSQIKGLNEEIFQMQKRLEPATNASEISDRDSSDPLSEIEKQEALLRNINTKNRHIRRLMHEIETLQNKNVEQSKTLLQSESEVKQLKVQTANLEENHRQVAAECKELKQTVNTLKIEIARLEGNLTFLEEDREKSEYEIKNLARKYEDKTMKLRQQLQDKDAELQQFTTPTNTNRSSNTNASMDNTNNLLIAVETRDKQIEELESKMKCMASEMLSHTKLMNKLSTDKNGEPSGSKKANACCGALQDALNAANKRARELTEMLASCEEGNQLQSKRVQHLQAALDSYQQSDDGLAKVVRKCSDLERKLVSRDKSIRNLVQEINMLHDVKNENQELRRRLNIDDDVSVSSKHSQARERNKQKIIDKLTIKLHASEEMRLQLKLTIYNLRKEVTAWRKQTNKPGLVENDERNTPRNGNKQPPSEVGELEDTSTLDTDTDLNMSKPATNSTQSQLKPRQPQQHDEELQIKLDERMELHMRDLQLKYEEVVQENDILRLGMHEILEKLHAYSASSNMIVIDNEILVSVLNALQSDGQRENAVGSQEELKDLSEHEELYLNLSTSIDGTLDKTEIEDTAMTMQKQLRDHESIEESIRVATPELGILNSSTRPTTPSAELDLPEIEPLHLNYIKGDMIEMEPKATSTPTLSPTPTPTPKISVNEEDALNYRQQYELLRVQILNSESDTNKQCAQLIEDKANLDNELKRQKCLYAFIKLELDKELHLKKDRELNHIMLIATLKQQLNVQRTEFSQLESNFQLYKQQFCHADHEVNELQRSKDLLEAQLANIIKEVLSTGVIADDIRSKDLLCLNNYGIIEDDMQVNYVTATEYEQQKSDYNRTVEKHEQLRRQLAQLEGLLLIAQDQIQSQQKLIHELTDNHIDLRHLVADLQSTNEEKFLLAKMQRDLDGAKLEVTSMRDDRVGLMEKCATLEKELQVYKELTDTKDKKFHVEQQNYAIKLKFLSKSLLILKEKYAKFTPLIFLTNFVRAYTKIIKESPNNTSASQTAVIQHVKEIVQSHLSKIGFQLNDDDDSSYLIKCIRLKTQRQLLEENIVSLNQKCQNLEMELNELKMRHVTENEHWKTIQALFSENGQHFLTNVGVNTSVSIEDTVKPSSQQNDQATQTSEKEPAVIESVPDEKGKDVGLIEAITQTAEVSVESKTVQTTASPELEKRDSNAQLQSTIDALNERDNQLTILEREISLIRQRASELEKMLLSSETENEKLLAKIKKIEEPHQVKNNHADIIEKTIISFHKLLSEKDMSIEKYQELLKNQQEQIRSNTEKLEADIESLKNTITNLNFNIKTKDIEIMELNHKLQNLNLETKAEAEEQLNDVQPNFHEITDDHIEKMFDQEGQMVKPVALEKQEHELKEVPQLLKQLQEAKDKIKYFEQTLIVKNEELNLLREKLLYYEKREQQEATETSPEIEQLRTALEEKDKHVNDLINTLRSFHDDQERYLNDASNNSADQLAKLGTDLKRAEATNNIYQTQLEAMRRQMHSLTQREKQTRELNITLRNELIKRPVVSIKTELNSRVKNENLQKRIHQLEAEIEECRTQLQRQQSKIDAKRASSANEVSLWEKQKRWQQNAEKFKIKLEETEAALDKTRTLLQSARNTIGRLEKEKHVLEAKLGKVGYGNMKCCRTSSCLNLNQHASAKYTPSESPDTYTSLTSSPAHGSPALTTATGKSSSSNTNDDQMDDDGGALLIEALKARIELQQRKLLAMEMEGKGKNVLNVEIERLLERCSNLESQNIRVEAKNLQLQLDNDLLRQGDANERQQKRINHLENYIIALKEEMATIESGCNICNCSTQALQTHADPSRSSAEQTILSLRNIVDKLRNENKLLKENRQVNPEQRQPLGINAATAEINRLQKKLCEAMVETAQLTKALTAKAKCSMCSAHSQAVAHSNEELNYIKEQLAKKSELLQKAKLLLTRAAAKEKVLKDQVALWKRKCSELQNVPVIDEISE